MAQSLTALANQLDSAGKTYGVPPTILLGVFGKETAFGNNSTTSTAGAQGLMQFLPSTAARYGYPLTNNPSSAQAQQQFNAAAHYLSDLYKQYGNWDTALRHYSGGGYGLAQVQAEANKAFGVSGAAKFFGGIPQTGPNVGITGPNITLPSIPNPLSGVESIAALLTSVDFWRRLGEAIAGILLIAMGLRSLTGTATTPLSAARTAARHIPL